MKFFRSLILVILTFALLLTTVACKDNETPSEGNIDVWGVHASVKVLQDIAAEEYTDEREEAEISLVMAKGEYESSQIIISPTVDVPEYTVSISDLVNGNGTKITTENIDIYHERYIQVSSNVEKNGAPIGMYPDALVPFSAIVKYGENKIKANENQGVYVTVETAIDQEPGVYTGEMTLDFKSSTKSVPVSINVVDVTVSAETHAKSIFLNDWIYEHGELNTSADIYEAYANKLIEYRLAPQRVQQEFSFTDKGIKNFVAKICEYLVNPRLSNLDIPYATKSQKYSNESDKSHTVIDGDVLEKTLDEFIKKCFEQDFNFMKKLTLYNRTLDEATFFGKDPEFIKLSCRVFNTTIAKVADELEQDATLGADKPELKAEMVESIRNIPHVVTFPYDGKYGDFTTDEYVSVNCPMFNYMDSETQRDTYRQSEKQPEMWWYGCDVPHYPYVQYHVDNVDTVNCRVLSWMQAEYGIVGNLYWATNDYEVQEDYFETDARRNDSSQNLEGIIFYPGGQYGLEEPIVSLRLEAIRDGMEEYELLVALKAKYEALGLDFESVMSSLSSSLYSGAKVLGGSKEFVDARSALLELCVASSSPAEMLLLGTEDNGNGNMTSKVYLGVSEPLKNNGVEVTEKVAHGEGYIYTVQTVLNEASNKLALTCEVAGKTYSYTQNLGPAVEGIELSDMVSGFSASPANVTATTVDASEIGLTGQRIKLQVGATENKSQIITLNSATITEKATENSKKIVFNVYNPTNDVIKLTISVKYKKTTVYSAMPIVELAPNSNNIVELNLANVVWSNTGSLDKIRFWFGEGSVGTFPEKVVYLDKAYVYYK